MVLDIKSLFNLGQVKEIDVELDYSDFEFKGQYFFKKPVHVKGTLTGKSEMVIADLQVTYHYSSVCDRCNEDFEREYSFNLHSTIVTSVSNEEDDSEFIIAEDYKIDLKEIVISEILLRLPAKNLCKEDCKGLCSKCGKNLNFGDCDCDKHDIDPRLEALKKLIN